jgi:predicted nuclease of restriction endonuclease-like (RecB) superfamily
MSKELINNIDTLYQRVKGILDNARDKVYRAANIEMVQAYWNVGKEIVEEEQNGKERAEYGTYLLKELSVKLTEEYGKGYTETNLRYMRLFYNTFKNHHALRDELSWTHYRLLLKVEKDNAREFYMEEAIAGNWSTRQLERQINSLYFERLLLSKDKKGMLKDGRETEEKMQAEYIIKDPFVLEFLNVKQEERLSEKDLETALINKLQHFLLELGKGFAFVGRQYRITAGTKHFYIDLVFYNYILKCFLVIDLKTEELTHQDIGQIDFYVRYFEDRIKQPGDNPTIGLILCTEKNKTIVKYSLLNESKQIFASKYQMYLPTEKQLEQEIQREKEDIEQEKKLSGKE